MRTATVSGDTIRQNRITRMSDLTDSMPTVTVAQNPIGNFVFIRGIGSSTNQGIEQSASIFHDGIYMGRHQLSRAPFMDLERVEVVQTVGFQDFTRVVVDSGMLPLLSMFAAISVMSGITGSASGGLQIFMATLADSYVAMGVDPQERHRLVAMASGGFDSLPHCGAVIAMLTITGLSHREANRDVGVITVVIPVVMTLALVTVAMLF